VTQTESADPVFPGDAVTYTATLTDRGTPSTPSGSTSTRWDPADDDATDRLTVIVPPKVSGSPKVKLKGLPEGCVAGDVAIKAKAKSAKVKEIKGKLTGRNVSERLGRSSGNKLRFSFPAPSSSRRASTG
jgi:hypothetical protein